MTNLHASIHDLVTADLDRLKLFERSSARSGANWDHRMRYEFEDGAKVELSAKFHHQLLFPANPGFTLLTVERHSDDVPATTELAGRISAEPILAWTLDYDDGQSWVDAVTASGRSSHGWTGTFTAIGLPTGAVQWQGPFDMIACSIIEDAFGLQHYRQGPVTFDGTASWLDLVRRVWAAQVAKEKHAATLHCAHGGAAKHHRDDPIPF